MLPVKTGSPGRTLRRWAARLRGILLLQALCLLLLRMLAAGVGALVLAAGVLGPAPGGFWRFLAWSGVALLAAFAAVRPLGLLREALGESRFVERLRGTAPQVASLARSALELARGKGSTAWEGVSPALLRAHVLAAERHLAVRPPARLLPWRALFVRQDVVWLLVGLLSSALLWVWPRARAGSWALLRGTPRAPEAAGGAVSEGARIAWVLDAVRWRLTPPDYTGEPSIEVGDEEELSVRAGTTVHLRFRSLLPARSAWVRLGERRFGVERTRSGDFEVRARILRGGTLHVWVEDASGRRWRDARTRRISVQPDSPPNVSLRWVMEDVHTGGKRKRAVSPSELLRLRWSARDDLCLGEVSLVVRLQGGPLRRRTLWEPSSDAHHVRGPRRGVIASTPQEWGARPGDRYEVYVSALDCDDVQGPKEAHSQSLHFVVPSEADEMAERSRRWLALRGRVLDTLAWELTAGSDGTSPSPMARRLSRAAGLRRRDALLLPSSELLVELRDALHARGIPWRREALRAKRALSRGERGGPARVDALEQLALALDEALSNVVREEVAWRVRRMTRLETELQRAAAAFAEAPRDEARSRLLRETAVRIEQQMARTAEARARTLVRTPDGFRNVSGGDPRSAARYDALASLREAAARGDVTSALEAVRGVRQDLERLAAALRERSGADVESSDNGRRARRLAEAIRRLASLEREQGGVLTETGRARREAVRRALERLRSGGLDTNALRRRASEAASRVRRFMEHVQDEGSRTELRAAADRLAELAEALDVGELGEALRLVGEGGARLDEVARSLRLEATMFPGHRGRTARAADRAEGLASRVGALREELESLVASASSASASGEGRADAETSRRWVARQGRLVEAVRRLAETLKDVGVSTKPAPLIVEAMESARGSLQKADPLRAERHQRVAVERLAAWRRRLERMGRGGGGGQDTSSSQDDSAGGSGGEGRGSNTAPVRIPLDSTRARRDFLERLRDAMREEVDPAFEGVVRDYQEGLMR